MTREILLVRHGRPVCDEQTPIPGSAFASWVRLFDDAPLDPGLPPPPSLLTRASSAKCIVTSTLRRSRDSAALLFPGRPKVCEPMFRETEMRFSTRLGFRLRPGTWDTLAQAAWFLGFSWPGGEPFRLARTRARECAERLVELAQGHGTVMLVGHGMMNALIRRELRRAGWTVTPVETAYWSLMVAARADAHGGTGYNS